MAVDPNIKKKADDIRNKIYGKEVRESLASGLEAMSTDVVENEGRQSVVEGRQDSVESQWQSVIDETTNLDVVSAPEIIAARNGEANLKTRIDKEHQEVTEQLEQTNKYFEADKSWVNVVSDYGAIGDGELHPLSEFFSTLPEAQEKYPVATSLNDSMDWVAIQQAVIDEGDYANGGGYVKIPEGYFVLNKSVLINSNMKIEGTFEKGLTDGVNTFGTHIRQTDENEAVFLMNGNTYGTEISKLRLSGKGKGIVVPRFNVSGESIAFSEFIFEKIHFNGGFDVALELQGSIGRVTDCDFSANKTSVHISRLASVWFEHNNFWQASEHHIEFSGNVESTRFNNNWIEKSGKAAVVFRAPVSIFDVTFFQTRIMTDNRQYPILFDGVSNSSGTMNIKQLTINNCMLSCIGGNDSVIRVNVAGNTNNANNRVNIKNSILSHCEEAGISTDYKWLYWVVEDSTIYSGWETGTADVWYSPENVDCIIGTINKRVNFATDMGVQMLPHNGTGLGDSTLYLSQTGRLNFYKDGTNKGIAFNTGKSVGYNPTSDIESIKSNLDNLFNALRDGGIIN